MQVNGCVTGASSDADQQLAEIEAAQRRVRQGRSDQIIDSTKKSEQRSTHRHRQIRTLENAIEDYEDIDPDE